MSLFPLDIQQFKDWSIQQLYYLLFPYIKEDFMGKGDCDIVHKTGNMTVMIDEEVYTVDHIISGGSDTLASIKEIQYKISAQEGRVTLETAEETGEFTGEAD
jgi:hypothetical protein